MIAGKKAAIFDLDGTILDSMGIWTKIDVAFLKKRKLELPEDYQRAIATMDAYSGALYTIERFALDEKPEELMQEWFDMAYDAYANHLPLKPGVAEYFSMLHRQGIPMAVATSSDQVLVLPALERTGLLPMLKTVVTAVEVSRGKGFPDIYEKASGILDVEPTDCVVFEDIVEGITGAKMGGFYTVGVNDGGSQHQEQEMRRLSDRYIMSFTELL